MSNVLHTVFDTNTLEERLGIPYTRLRAWLLAGYIKPSYCSNCSSKKDFYSFSDVCKVYLFDNLLVYGLTHNLAARIIANIDRMDAHSMDTSVTGYVTITLPISKTVLKVKALLE